MCMCVCIYNVYAIYVQIERESYSYNVCNRQSTLKADAEMVLLARSTLVQGREELRLENGEVKPQCRPPSA